MGSGGPKEVVLQVVEPVGTKAGGGYYRSIGAKNMDYAVLEHQ
jgi:hypothetical protein